MKKTIRKRGKLNAVKNQPQTAVEEFNAKTQIQLSKMGILEDFRKKEEMVDFVFKIGHILFKQELDKKNEAWLLNTGGKLTGCYAYFGQKASRARAERDVYVKTKKEIEGDLMLGRLDADYKVTQARAEVRKELEELERLVIEKECEKNQWENITDATQTMISFIQSDLKIKKSEKTKGRDQYDNH